MGPYQPATGVRNPEDSAMVADFKATFRQHALPEGSRRAVQLGAIPFVVCAAGGRVSVGRVRLVHHVGHVLAQFGQACLSVCSAEWEGEAAS